MCHGPIDILKPVVTASVTPPLERRHHTRRELIQRARELGIHR
jgi:hypothetical protein